MENKNPEENDPSLRNENNRTSEEAARGKKAIEAAQISSGENPNSKKAKDAEKEDSTKWINEG